MGADGWTTFTVGEITSKERNGLVGGPFGSDLVSKDYVISGVPVIRGANMGKGRWVSGDFVFVSKEKADSLSANCAKPGDLVFTQRGTIGQVALVPEAGFDRYLISQSQMKLSVDPDKASGLFLFYVFCTTEQQNYIQQNAIRTGVPHTNLGILKNTPVRLPALSEQTAIASVLTALDAKIELNQRINAELEGMAKLLYDYWFVQFDFPMSAAQAAALGKPHLTGHPYRASGGQMIYNQTLKRDIPDGWTDGRIADFCSLNSKSWGRDDYPDMVNYVDLANTKNGRINQVVIFPKKDAPSRAQRFLRAGDTIIGTVRPENCSFACVPVSEKQLTGSTGFAVLTPNTPIHREFNYIGLTSEFNIKRLSVIASGAAYPAVNPEAVAAMQIAIPPMHLIEAYHHATSASFDLIENHEQQNQELTRLRDWLLPMLMNGQVTVESR
jgi:type I restriction enzyme S subunit